MLHGKYCYHYKWKSSNDIFYIWFYFFFLICYCCFWCLLGFLKKIYFIFLFICLCVCVYMYTKEARRGPESVVIYGQLWAAQHACRESNSSPLQKQYVLTTEPFLQSLFCFVSWGRLSFTHLSAMEPMVTLNSWSSCLYPKHWDYIGAPLHPTHRVFF